jgi:excinuclease ABC subunit B
LLGITGSGKTFTIANVIEKVQRPTLVISHNKTLAAQLYSELKQFFPENAVEYFVSYYDYYQPEAYIPQTDTYIEKDAAINDELERLRLSTTSSLLHRKDIIVVASVSCIYGIGNPDDYKELMYELNKGIKVKREDIVHALVDMQYERNDIEFLRGKFRVRGDVVEVFPAYAEKAIRIELEGDVLEKLSWINPLTGDKIESIDFITIYPAKHFVVPYAKLENALTLIRAELEERLKELRANGKLLEAQRLESRTNYDLEMMKEVGYCPGIENYSRHLSGRKAGTRPSVLIDFFSKDYLMVIDESHVTIPQLRGMYFGDRSRKETLVEHGFRLPSALDNRPLKFNEFESLINQAICVSATPGPYELSKSNKPVEQIIRPTGLIDPEIIVHPTEKQIDDLLLRIKERVKNKERVLVTTLTKRMAEDLSEFLEDKGIKVRYIHSEIDALQRVEILRGLREADFDVLVGINLLREGLDLPEVSMVAILDADKEGFLRSQTSLIQTAGRAARHIKGTVIMYADTITDSMKATISETNRRRKSQIEYNIRNNIKPQTVKRAIQKSLGVMDDAKKIAGFALKETKVDYETQEVLYHLESEMRESAEKLDFEKAATLRDKIKEIKGGYLRK